MTEKNTLPVTIGHGDVAVVELSVTYTVQEGKITINTLGGPVDVWAQRVNEFLAVHRPCASRVGDCWDLSHIESGRKLGRFVSFKAARAFADVALANFAQLSCADPDLHDEERSHFLALLREYGGVMVRRKGVTR